MITRRTLVVAGTAALLAPKAALGTTDAASVRQQIAALEAAHGGRLGVAIRTGARKVAYRGNERFPLCSTWKASVVACVLSRVDSGREQLDRRVRFGRDALVPYSPVTGRHLADGMRLDALCEAAIVVSDNTAANLLLDAVGGPSALTAYLRKLGDPTTRLDRREPELNSAIPGDPRDTTTPAAMLDTLGKLLLGPALSAASRATLTGWMEATQTGLKKLRAGAPPGWRVADKTGSGDHRTSNDIAVLWPPAGDPVLVTAYYTGGPATEDERSAVIAAVGRIAATV